jgi:hypothetical protein
VLINYIFLRFVDRDMFMRYRGGGVGHKVTRTWDEFLQSDGARIAEEEEDLVVEEQEDEENMEVEEHEVDEDEEEESEESDGEEDLDKVEADEGEELDEDILAQEGYDAL